MKYFISTGYMGAKSKRPFRMHMIRGCARGHLSRPHRPVVVTGMLLILLHFHSEHAPHYLTRHFDTTYVPEI